MKKMINTSSPVRKYRKAAADTYFIDKSNLIGEVVAEMENGFRFQCVTRPRRFGKSYGANMVAYFFGKGDSAKKYFASQKIGANPNAMKYCGKYNVVFIRGDKVSTSTTTKIDGTAYKELIRIKLIQELMVLYPKATISLDMNLSDVFDSILEEYESAELVVVMDEWDYLLNRNWISKDDIETYTSFLSDMLKDEEIIKLAYFTGVLPMPVFSSLSDLNMFIQYTMSESKRFSTCFGFTEEEVDDLYHRYCHQYDTPSFSREDLRDWYNGYTCAKNVSIYNPQSVGCALSGDKLRDYWPLSGAANELFTAISANVQSVWDDIAYLASGLSVPLKLILKKAPFSTAEDRDTILSKMVVLGFLSYSGNTVRVPNKELMNEFDLMILHQAELDYVYN